MVEASHSGCAARTRVSLPASLPVRAVRRIFCARCECLCEATAVSELRPSVGERLRGMVPAVALPASISRPSSITVPRVDLRWLTLPVAAVAVFAILGLLNGDEAPPPEAGSTATVAKPDGPAVIAKGNDNAAKNDGSAKTVVPTDAQLISESTFSLALPAGWDRVKPGAGATFAAVSSDGLADTTLWIQNDPKLDFASFEATSLAQLEMLTGSARVVERNVGPSVEASSITLAPKDAPDGAPTYEVVLRGSGDNWYYLATTYQAGAPAEAVEGVELIQGSFLPLGGKG